MFTSIGPLPHMLTVKYLHCKAEGWIGTLSERYRFYVQKERGVHVYEMEGERLDRLAPWLLYPYMDNVNISLTDLAHLLFLKISLMP